MAIEGDRSPAGTNEGKVGTITWLALLSFSQYDIYEVRSPCGCILSPRSTPQSAPFMVSLQTSVLCGLHPDGQPGRPGCSSPASFLHLVYNKSWEDPVSSPPLPCCPTFCNLSTIRQPGDPSSPPFSLDSDSFLQKPQAMCVRKATIRTELALESSPSLPSLVPSSHLIDFPPLFHSWFPQLYNSPTLFLHFVMKLP